MENDPRTEKENKLDEKRLEWMKQLFLVNCKKRGVIVPENIEDISQAMLETFNEAFGKDVRLLFNTLEMFGRDLKRSLRKNNGETN